MKEKSSRRMIILPVLFLALVVGITLVCLPYITRLSEPDVQTEFKEWVIFIPGTPKNMLT